MTTTEANAVGRSRNNVTIGCKHPMGVILELDEELSPDAVEAMNTVQNGPIGKRKYFPSGKKYVLNGANADHPKSPQKGRTSVGWGLTEIPTDFWEAWLAQHSKFALVANGTIFAVTSTRDAQDEADKRQSVVSGLEPMNPRKPAPGILPDNGRSTA